MRQALVLALALGACAHGNAADVDASGGGGDDTPPVDSKAPVDSGCGDIPCDAVYVTVTGDDNNAGTKASPMFTIGAAMTKAAQSSPPLAVFVGAGTFKEQLTMVGGVEIYGGFTATWVRDGSAVTEVHAASPVVTFDAITVDTALDRLTIKSDDATATGASSYAIVATNSTHVELRDVTVEAGAGAAGTDGTAGVDGGVGSTGTNGGKGVEHSSGLCSSHTVPTGGGGGASACGRVGGKGGDPGVGDNGGKTGASGTGGSPGGPGGLGDHSIQTNEPPNCQCNGTKGTDGNDGANGQIGAAGVQTGTFDGAVYVVSSGVDGTSGTDGAGGGGGGGGAGGTTDCDSSGSSGGGGGGGGCHGTAGTAGTGGGGSFGIIAVDSSVAVKSSMVLAGPGGAGGAGGAGGGGGGGGNGGAGGAYGGDSEQDDGGFGAAGGHGGAGGFGGAGGGGGGGPSAAVVCLGTATIAIPQSTLSGGTAGKGGAAPGGNAGADGLSTRAINCSFF